MTDHPQWIVVLFVPRADGKTDKLPVDYRTRTAGVNVHDPQFWTDFATASALAATWGPAYGVGFVLTRSDPFFCVDIDNAAADAGAWSPTAMQIVSDLPGCMIEISHSGRGLHVWGRYPDPPEHTKKRLDLGVECYTEARFIAWGTHQTGTMAPRCDAFAGFVERWFPARTTATAPGVEVLPSAGPRPDWRGPSDDDDLIRRMLQSRSAASTFGTHASAADLWMANAEVLGRAYPSSRGDAWDRSSADAALAQHLAFWTGCDQERMHRLMLRSGLAREKWHRPDYLPETLANAARMQRDVLQDRPAPTPTTPTPPVGGPPEIEDVGADAATFLSPDQQRELFRGCVYIVDAHRVLTPGGRLLRPDQFRALYGGYTFAMDRRNERISRNAFEALTESQALRAPRADGLAFKPQLPYGAIVESGDRRLANQYWPIKVRTSEGDVSPFIDHIGRMYPDRYEQDLVRYTMACLCQHLGYKAQWALVLQGVEGNGKSFLARCLQYTIGERYTYWPRADKIAKDFNGWLMNHLLYIVEELMVGDRQDLIDHLKPLITSESGIEIERKGIDQTTGEIVGNFWFNTNHRNAYRKTRNDRRLAILFSAQQTEPDLRRTGVTGEYMHRLYHWAKREDGLAKVAHYLMHLKIPAEFDFTQGLQRAPVTRSTDEALAASMNPTEQEVLDAIEREEIGFRGGWVSSGALDRLLERTGKARYCPINQRRGMLQTLGYDWHPSLPAGRVNNPVMPDAAKVKLFCRTDSPAWGIPAAAAVAAAYERAQGVAGR